MAIDEDIFRLQGFAARLGSSMIAQALADELVKQLKISKASRGPGDHTGTLTKGIMAVSPVFGSRGNFSIGVGDLSILGLPTDAAPRDTIKDFLAFTKQIYGARAERNKARAIERDAARQERLLTRQRSITEKREAVLRQKSVRRAEKKEQSRINRLSLHPKERIERNTARIQRLESDVAKIRATGAVKTRGIQNLASQRRKIEKRIEDFYEKSGYTPGTGADRLKEFMSRYKSVSGKGKDRPQYLAAKRIRKSITNYNRKRKATQPVKTQIKSVQARINEAWEKLNEAHDEISRIRKR